jgi:hypothetical protein
MFGSDHKIKSLEEIEWLSKCSKEDLRTIARSADLLVAKPDEVVRYSTRTDSSFVLILDGEASVDDDTLLQTGDHFGAAGLLTDCVQSGEVRMVTPGRVLIMSARQFTGLVRRCSGFALGLAREMARDITRVA